MGVYIKSMEMPKNCWLCPLSVFREMPREMLVCKITKEEVLRNKVDGSCPLVPVPPHGRLIDAKKLKMEEYMAFISAQVKLAEKHDTVNSLINEAVHEKLHMLINDAPAVIEEE